MCISQSQLLKYADMSVKNEMSSHDKRISILKCLNQHRAVMTESQHQYQNTHYSIITLHYIVKMSGFFLHGPLTHLNYHNVF